MGARAVSGIAVSATLTSLVVLAAAFGPLSDLLPGADQSAHSQLLMFTAIGVVFAATGAFLVWRTGNLVGWVLLGIGVCLSTLWIGLLLHARQLEGAELGALARLLTVAIGFAWIPSLFLLAVVLPLVFPTGRPPSPIWRWVAIVAGVGMIGGLIGAAFEALTLPTEQVLGEESSTWWIINVTLIVGIAGAVASVVARMRLATVVERQQIKWVTLALSVVAGLVLLSFTPVGTSLLGDNPVAQNLLLLTFALIPLSILAAISRFRLYAIDRIISRTLSYTIVVGLLALVYAGAVVALSSSFPSQDSDLAVAISTLVAAFLFSPLMRRIRAIVDRRFNRAAVDREQELARVRSLLRSETNPRVIGGAALEVVNRTLQPSTSGIWFAPDTSSAVSGSRARGSTIGAHVDSAG
jgi:MFS family permease